MIEWNVKGQIILIDTEDYDRISVAHVLWLLERPNGDVYVRLIFDGVETYLHRAITGAPKGTVVDHINGNTLDNRRENLRVCSVKQNVRNSRKMSTRPTTSRFKGVCRIPDSKCGKERWVAYIRHEYKRHHIGVYERQEDAARAYNVKAVHFFGEYARLNEI